MTQPRLLLVSVATVMGGAEVYLVRMAALLCGRARLFAVCAHRGLAEELQELGVRVYLVPMPFGPQVQRWLKYPLLLMVVLWVVLRHRIPMVHVNGYQSAFLLGPLRLAGRRVSITPHHLPRGTFALSSYAAGVRWANEVVNVSDAIDREHRQHMPSLPTRVIPNWIPQIPEVMPPRPPQSTRQVLYIGRLAANKGLADLFQAIRLLNGEVRLIVSGEGPMRAALDRMAAGLPIEFCGYSPDLRPLYAGADALIVPSHGPEGSCLVALEAMAYGLPCILSDLSVYREIAQQGRTALLFPAGDAAAIAECIRNLQMNRGSGSEMASAAFHMLRTQYSQEAAARIYLSVFGLAA